MTDLQDKLAELRRRNEQLEESVIEAMLETESAASAVESAEEALNLARVNRADRLAALGDEREGLLDRIEEQERTVEEARSEVDAVHLRVYDGLRERRGGLAVAQLKASEECEVCGMQITSRLKQQVRRGQVETCPTCGRILYHP
jgi:predicted  nucleic acid-binding Zn-ribbon protein